MEWKADLRWKGGRLDERLITMDPDAALAHFRRLLARDDLIGQPVAARLVSAHTGKAIYFSRFDRDLGDGRIHPRAPLDVERLDDGTAEATKQGPGKPKPAAMPETQDFAADLKRWMTMRGVDRQEAAALLDVSVRTLDGWIGGKKPQPEGPVRKLAGLV